MTRPTRGRGGKFTGSIGDGKTVTPTAGRAAGRPVDLETETEAHWDLQAATSAYGQRIRELARTTDTELAQLHDALWTHQQNRDRTIDSLHHALGHQREYIGTGRDRHYGYTTSPDDTVTEARAALDNPDIPAYRKQTIQQTLTDHDTSVAAITATQTRIRELDTIYQQHRWTRAFLVQGGHVHAGMYDCPTLHREGKTTRLVWLPEYSGAPEEEIVNDAGERACSTPACFPTAPVDVLSRPTRIYSDEERRQVQEAEERRTQREASRAARAAKAPTATGEPLTLTVGTRGTGTARVIELKTERTALTYAIGILAAQRTGDAWRAPYEVDPDHYDTTVHAICDAIAGKRGVTRADILTELEPKVARKMRQ